MGSPVEHLSTGSTERAVEIIYQNEKELDKDIEYLGNFQDAVEDIELSNRYGRREKTGMLQSNGKSDTEKVLELYRKHFFDEDDYPEIVDAYAEKLDISVTAADFFDEITKITNLNNSDTLSKLKYLDNSNPMNEQYVKEVVSLAEYPRALRRMVKEDMKIEADSLETYSREINDLEEELLELNRENPLPMGIDTAVDVVENLESLESRVEQLEKRRIHELRRRPEIVDGGIEKNLEKYYEDEDFGNPVLQDLIEIKESINEAYDGIIV